VLDRELGDALAVAVRDIVIEIRLAQGVRYKRSLGRDVEVDGQTLRLKLNQVAEGQEKQLLVELEAPEGSAGNAADLASVSVKGEDAATKAPKAYDRSLRVQYSADADQIARSTNTTVVAAAAKARANEVRAEAIKLRDAGQGAQASALLKEESKKLKVMAGSMGAANAPAAAEARAFSADLDKESEDLAAPSGDWNAARKSMKQKAYSTSQQQTY
jgi:hypothetical protein